MKELKLKFDEFPELETERLKLIAITEDLTEQLFPLRSDPDIMRFIPRPLAKVPEDTRQWIRGIAEAFERNELLYYALQEKSSQAVFGTLGLVRWQPRNYRAEIGYLMSKQHRGKGYMQEAVRAIIAFAFREMNFNTLYGIVDPENQASSNVLLKAGLRLEGHLKENEFYEGRFLDSLIYGITRKEFEEKYYL